MLIIASVDVLILKRRADVLCATDEGDEGDTFGDGAFAVRHLMLRLIEARAAFLFRTTLH
ncbi:hypothetical protein [Propionivibrio sp.]|uniref:hypothetical protein n=1 Tax=Propionivibrio sp. TaxID=2212460 RepID=UPI003BEF5354